MTVAQRNFCNLHIFVQFFLNALDFALAASISTSNDDGTGPMMAVDDGVRAARVDFIEKMGMIAQRENLPRIAGRVLGVLIFDAQPISFGDLATVLDVSRGSISASVRLLEERGLIRRMGMHGKRGDYFIVAEDAHANMLRGVKTRAELAQREIGETLDMVPEAHVDIRERLSGFKDFYIGLIESVDGALVTICACSAKKNAEANGFERGEKTND